MIPALLYKSNFPNAENGKGSSEGREVCHPVIKGCSRKITVTYFMQRKTKVFLLK